MHKNTKTLGIIPARYASSRFPGKALADIGGKSMIRRVYEQVVKSESLDEVVVATDDERIFGHVESFGGKVLMTKKTHRNGTERCAEVIENQLYKNYDFIVNIQGDEPFIHPAQIDLVVDFLKKNESCEIATLAKKIDSEEELFNPNVVKVVFGHGQKTLYFSRLPIPFFKNNSKEDWLEKGTFYKHIGLYAFRKNTLRKIAKLPQTPLEKAESLEQLRWLENGIPPGIAITEIDSFGIDTPEDLDLIISRLPIAIGIACPPSGR